MPTDQIKSSIPLNINDNNNNLDSPSPSSSYCLLTNGDLHFLPYSHSNNGSNFILNDNTINNTLFNNNTANTPLNYPIYSQFLDNKTVSSFDSNQSSPKNILNDNYINSTIHENTPIMKLLKNYKSHAIYLPDHYIPLEEDSNQIEKIKSLMMSIFSHWNHYNLIDIKKLTGGITNMLLECNYNNPISNITETVLVRTYGNGTDLIIDRDREFVSHLILNSKNLAPPIHARFGNGLVYGFIEGRSLSFDELSNNLLYPLIASKLACLHKLADINIINDSLNKLKLKFNTNSSSDIDIWSVLRDWVDKVPDIPSMINQCIENSDILSNNNNNSIDNSTSLSSILLNEINWLQNEIGLTSVKVISHNDLLSGNIIIPKSIDISKNKDEITNNLKSFNSNPLQFIDYEYMMPAPRAFDIANHFMEWQGFDCDKSKIPQFTYNNSNGNYENLIVKNWCKYYLNAFHSSNPNLNPYNNDTIEKIINNNIDKNLLNHLVNEVALHYGLPGLYWGIWAGIQSKISLIDFDYSSYSCNRLIEYWNWKRNYLKNKK